MRRRPTEVYATALPYSTGELIPLRREPRFTRGINPEQAIGGRDSGGSLGSAFTLPPYIAPAPAPAVTASPAAPVNDCG